MAGIIPGILSALMYSVYVMWRSNKEFDKEKWGDHSHDAGLRTTSQGGDSPLRQPQARAPATSMDTRTVTVEQPGQLGDEEHQEVPRGRQYSALFKVGLISRDSCRRHVQRHLHCDRVRCLRRGRDADRLLLFRHSPPRGQIVEVTERGTAGDDGSHQHDLPAQ